MQTDYVLPKVIRPRPNLVFLGAVRCSAHVRFANVDLVNALLVPVQVVLGGEARLPVAAWDVALEWLLMAKLMFAAPCQSLTVKANVRIGHT